jgi:uncharacterized protein YjdB
VEKPSVVWSSNEPGVATVMDGRVVAVGAGTAVITATAGTLKATAQVTVRVPEFAKLTVTPAKTQLKVKDSLLLKAAALDKKGAKVGGVPVTWRSGNAQVATVGPDGRVQAVKKGTVTVTAASGTLRATAQVTVRVPEFAKLTVTPAKTQLKVRDALVLKAAALDKKGARVGGVPVIWRSSNAQVATVGPDGKVQAVKKGTVTITASAGKKSASSTITVTEAASKSKSSKSKTTSKSKSKPRK